MRRAKRNTLLQLAVVLSGALLVGLAYLPGLTGPFLFDDFGNLNVLGAFGPIDGWNTFLYYVTSGTADPLGRPVSLLSFLLDGQTWPTAPEPFKRTNLLLHLLNATLLGRSISVLQRSLNAQHTAPGISHWTPWVASLLWAAHPFFVSTTLYVVQRQTMLSMTFTMLALLAWSTSLQAFARGRVASGWTIALLGFGGATLMAGMSKANGLLAPMLIGVCHIWFLRPAIKAPARRQPDLAALLLLALPSLLIVAYVAYIGSTLWTLQDLQGRDWNLPQRLLTQPRALWHYLGQLLVPRAGGGGVYVEGFQISRDWFEPTSTIVACAALAAATLAATAFRVKAPRLSFAWLFFITGHLLESSTIPLELYFEHRNYLPAAFFGWPLVHALMQPVHTRMKRGLLLAIVTALLLLTWQRASLWGNADLLAEVSALHEPSSARSLVFAAQQQVKRGDVLGGYHRITALQRSRPDSVDVAIASIGVECAATGALASSTLALSQSTLTTAKDWNYGLYVWMQRALQEPQLRDCHGFGARGLQALLAAAERNPGIFGIPEHQRDLLHLHGLIAISNGDTKAASAAFEKSLTYVPDAEYALVQAAELGTANAPAAGVYHLDTYTALSEASAPPQIRDMATLHAWLLRRHHRNQSEVERLRSQLASEVRARSPQ